MTNLSATTTYLQVVLTESHESPRLMILFACEARLKVCAQRGTSRKSNSVDIEITELGGISVKDELRLEAPDDVVTQLTELSKHGATFTVHLRAVGDASYHAVQLHHNGQNLPLRRRES